MSMETLRLAAEVIGLVGTVGGFVLAVLKALREMREGIKCLLRADMMHTYYKHHDHDAYREYEAQNFEMEYAAYKHLGGNSFIDKIYADVQKWEVLP